jgi:hypothetical protein
MLVRIKSHSPRHLPDYGPGRRRAPRLGRRDLEPASVKRLAASASTVSDHPCFLSNRRVLFTDNRIAWGDCYLPPGPPPPPRRAVADGWSTRTATDEAARPTTAGAALRLFGLNEIRSAAFLGFECECLLFAEDFICMV